MRLITRSSSLAVGRWLLALGLLQGASVSCATEEASQPQPAVEEPRAPAAPSGPSAPVPPTQGLTCIKGGSTREEVRAAMGEPDSIAFGDWLYGRSSVTFGYGVVLDYSNAGGNLVLCP